MGGTGEFLHSFAKGSEVEVSTDEEGFKGAWYVATVLEPPPTSRSASKRKTQNPNTKLYVQYHSLLADEHDSEPLREHVRLPFVRPSPPPDAHLPQSFELNDVVDAFHRDGWWTGVITGVLHNSTFLVTFQNPLDEIEFGISELRVHRKWLDGIWVRPEKQRTTGLMLSAGEKVEVCFDKADHGDVWFPAVVLELSGNDSFLVEYQIPGIGDEAGILKATVDSLHIRPSPPLIKNKDFVLLEKVDAFYDFGWWSGVITKNLADSRYVVFFKHTNKEKELNHSELRPHIEWKDGKWFIASQDFLIPSDYDGNLGQVCNSANNTEMAVSLGSLGTKKGYSEEIIPCSLNSRENPIEQATPRSQKASFFTSSVNKKPKQTSCDTGDTHSRPSKRLKEGDPMEAPSLTTSQLNTTPTDTPSMALCGFASPITGNTGTNCSEQPIGGDQLSAKADSISQGKKVRSKRQKVGELDHLTTDTVRGKGRSGKSQINSPKASAGGKKGDAEANTAEDSFEEVCVTKKIDVPTITSIECNGMKGSRAKKPRQLPGEESLESTRDQKQQLDDLATQKIKEGNQFEGGGDSIQKKRRGRPPKLLAKSPIASVAGKQQNGDVAADEMVVKDCITNEVVLPTTTGVEFTRTGGSGEEYLKLVGDDKKLLDGPLKQKNKSSSMMKMHLAKKDKLSSEKVLQASSKQHEKHSSKRGKRRTISLNSESPIQDSLDASGGVVEKNCMMKEEMAIENLPSNLSDDQPLSMWFEGMHSPKTLDGSSVSLGMALEKFTEGGEKQKEIVMQSPAVGAKGDIVPIENQCVPFVKKTLLWKTIESMEVFRMMPQRPHFRPLDSCKESSREGLAIGSMVTFSSVVENASRLQFDDPRSIIEDSLDILLELESHGFNVEVVRDRLTRLLLIKDKQEELEDQSRELESQVMDVNLEKSKIDEQIDEIDKQIRELQEKRALVVSLKEIKDSEVASVESTVEGINEGIRIARLEFEGLAAAPW